MRTDVNVNVCAMAGSVGAWRHDTRRMIKWPLERVLFALAGTMTLPSSVVYGAGR